MSSTETSVSIVGCGWLGFPLATRLVGMGYQVSGSTTTESKIEDLKSSGIHPYLVKLGPGDVIPKELLEADYLIINVPPGRRDPDRLGGYAASVEKLVKEAARFAKVRKVLFVSSSSVYGDDLDVVSESSPAIPATASGQAIRKAEISVIESGIPSIILRFGGLAGAERHPGRFLAGRKMVQSGEQVINFLHLDDAVRVIIYMLKHEIENEIYNVVSPMHPSKKDFYKKMALSLGLEPPTFADAETKFKREVSVEKLTDTTDFTFRYPDPMNYQFDV